MLSKCRKCGYSLPIGSASCRKCGARADPGAGLFRVFIALTVLAVLIVLIVV